MLRVSEVYRSVQGEGPSVGEPTIFVRFAGCNLRCPGWPCDTPYAIFPKLYRNEWEKENVNALVHRVTEAAGALQLYNVCLTGGEPFLQNHEELERFVGALHKLPRVSNVEAFSNGTIRFPPWAVRSVTFTMDWKLPGSGEDSYDQNRLLNITSLGEGDAVKFVIRDREDFDLAVELYKQYLLTSQTFGFEVFYGAVWGAIDNATLVDWVLELGLPWRLNVQMHNYIWDRSKRGI